MIAGPGARTLITGSFQVDSSHINPSGNTDISSFINNLSFTANIDVPPFTFDPASGFVAKQALVNPDGEFVGGAQGFSTFSGTSNTINDFTAIMQIITSNMSPGGSSIDVNFVGGEGNPASGSGGWCNNDPNTDPMFQCHPPGPEPVPEPATLVLVAVPMLLCVWYARRRGAGSRPVPL